METELHIGAKVGGYRIEGRAGRGGMGVVYRATQIALDRQVALKLLTPELAEDEAFRKRFQRESRLLAATDHPNVITIYEAGEHEGRLFLAMRYVEGADLGGLLKREGRLDPHRATEIVAQVAAALDTAHARGLIHRDVKPANVLIETRDGAEHAYLTDFGLTKAIAGSEGGLTGTGHFVGTVDFIAPEQVTGGHVDARADVYALGCVLFTVLTGRVPYQRESDVSKIFAHVNDPPPSLFEVVPDAPNELDAVVRRAMAKDPNERFPSAGDLGRAALAAAEGQAPATPERTVAAGEAAPVTDASQRAAATVPAAGAVSDGTERKPRRRGAALAIAVVAALIAIAAVLLVSGGGDDGETPQVEDDALHAELSLVSIPVEGTPERIAVGENAAWVASTRNGEVTPIEPDGTKGEPIAVGDAPAALATGAGAVLVVVQGGSGIARIDATTREMTGTTRADLDPDGDLVFDGDAFWGVVSDRQLARIDAETGQAVETVATPPGLLGRLTFGDEAVWATAEMQGRRAVLRIDPASGDVVATVPLGRSSFPEGLAFGEDVLWVLDSTTNSLLRVDPATNRVTTNTKVRFGISSDDVAVEAGAIWQANFEPSSLRRFDPATGAVAETIRIDTDQASELAVGLGSAWITLPDTDQVTRLGY